MRQSRWTSRFILVALAMTAGCHPEKEPLSNSGVPPDELVNARPAELVGGARQRFQTGDLESAARMVSEALIADPERDDAKMLAAEIEAVRRNHQAAADLAASIDMRSKLGMRAAEFRYRQLMELGSHVAAADALLASIAAVPNQLAWRHEAWRLLNRLGRREEASRQVDMLCRFGQANRLELLSLLRRNDSFPFLLGEDESPHDHFDPGLGMAKWHFTQRDYQQALSELAGESDAGFSTPAACALYGRLLAETQAFELMPTWFARCPAEVNHCSDYWAALGVYFFDRHQYEASVRALMEALIRDPTDDWSAHRLAKSFDAMGRRDDGEQFRNRAIVIVQSERHAKSLAELPGDTTVPEGMTQDLLDLGRPFEALAWTQARLPPQAVQARASVAQQLAQLNRNERAARMAFEMALLDMDRSQFSLEPAISQLGQASSSEARKTIAQADPLSQPRLVNVAAQAGLDFQWYQDIEINLASIPLHEVMGGGIGVVDYDLDGWPDVYLSQGSGDPPTDSCTRSNLMYRNVRGEFELVTDWTNTMDYNYSTGLAVGDVNQDGFPDLFLGSLGRNRLLINNGDGTFQEATHKLGEIEDQFTSSLSIADINGDALPDLYEAIYLEMEGGFKLPDVGPDGHELQPSPLSYYAQSDRWFQNLGDGRFLARQIDTEVALAATGLGIMVTDFDGDGLNEVFVANDGRPNHFLNQADNDQFRNTADAKGVANGFTGEANACMGIAAADFDRSGTLDLHVTNFSDQSANHFLQTTSAAFTDSAVRYGIDALSTPYVGFGTKAIDIDRNGWTDLIVTNGHVFDERRRGEAFQMAPQLYRNVGHRFDLASVDDDSGYWSGEYLGRSIAMLDFNRDSAIDFLVGHLDQPIALLRNETPTPGHWIQLELVGTSSERDAIGARVQVKSNDQTWFAWVTAGDGYLSNDEPVLDVGLGEIQSIDELSVDWPSGSHQTFSALEIDGRYLIIEGESEVVTRTR